MCGLLVMVGFGILVLYLLLNFVIHMGNGWNNKNIVKQVDRIISALDRGMYTVGEDKNWSGCGSRCTGGSILTCYENGELKADGLLLSFTNMFVRSTWYITDEKNRQYYTGFVQGLRLHKKIKEIYKKEKKT